MFAVRARITAWICFLIVVADVLLVRHCLDARVVLIGAGVLSALIGLDRRSWRLLAICPIVTVAVIGGIERHIQQRADTSLLTLQNKHCFAYGTICDTRISTRNSLRYFVVDIRRVLRPAPNSCRGRVLVSVPCLNGRRGDHVFLRGTIRGAKPPFYPWDYNEPAFFERLGIDARLSLAEEPESLQVIPSDGGRWRLFDQFFSSLRTKIRDFHAKANGRRTGDLLTSVVIGSQAVDLEDDIKTEFRNLGLAHILAASGFNIGVVVGVSYLALRPLLHRRLLVKFFAFLVLLFYIGLTGMSASIQRAALMWSVTLLVTAYNREVHGVAGLLFPLAVTVLLDPWAPFDDGLQLSYAATAGLTLSFEKASEYLSMRPRILFDAVASTIFAILSVLPIELQYFWQVGLLSLPANILVVPFIPIITILGFMTSAFACLCPEAALLLLLDKLPGAALSFFMWILEFLNTIPGCRIIGGAPEANCIFAYYVSLFLFCTCRRRALTSITLGATFLISLFGLFYKGPLPAPLVVLTTEGALVVDEHRSGRMVTKSGFPDRRLDRAAGYLAARSNGITKQAEFVFPAEASESDAALYSNYSRLNWLSDRGRKEAQLTKDTYLFAIHGKFAERLSPRQFIQLE